MARKKAQKAEEANAPAAKQSKITHRYVSPERVEERKRQGWKVVEGEAVLRGGAVLMEKA